MGKRRANSGTSFSAPDLESALVDALGSEKEMRRFAAPVCIDVHCFRKRLADLDGNSIKAVLDGVVKAGILADDSSKFISEIRYRQSKSGTESTTLRIRPA